MSTTTIVTADELLALPTGMGKRYELVAGELRTMSPSGWRHGQITANVSELLAAFIRTKDLGRSFGAETGFLLRRDPDTVRAPDFAYIAKIHLPKMEPQEAFWPGAPDLAVEVLSPDDRTSEVNEKIAEWLAAGCAAVWIVDPKLQAVTIHRSAADAHVEAIGDTLVGDPIVPGFSCAVDELFR
jgi:Uma2 family endonuclease